MSKLIIISNRLPVNITKVGGKLNFEKSVGGLATALSSLKEFPKKVWLGWPGIVDEELSENEKKEITTKLKKNGRIPIYLNQEKIDKYYFGFSNKTIWPLFHYFPLYTEYSQENWNSYKEVNKRFCNEILKIAKEEDEIWIHDYHLLLLPKLIREYLPNTAIGFFLHIPFPSSELFRQLPYRKEILEGLLGADLIGFQTYDYAGHFNDSVRRVLGYEHIFSQINTDDKVVYSDIFPIGINYNKYSRAKKNKRTKRIVGVFKKKFRNRKVIISIDRLDYSKGIPNRIEAFEYFLEKYPEYIEKVNLIICAVPSRTQVDTYTQLKYKVDELVGKVNGRFGNIHWTPIYYLYRSLPFEEIAGLYNLADIAMVTPIRDGMNLVAKEFIAAKTDGKGVLILSESAGASQELGEAIIVNANDKWEMAEAIRKALELPIEKQKISNRIMQDRLKRYDISRWASDFLDRLNFVKGQREIFKTTYLAGEFEENLLDDYKKSKQRMLLLDYDGTLVPFSDKPELAVPDEEILDIIEKLAAQEGNSIVLISGRDRNTMESWFSNLNITLVAEHGVWIKDIGKEWKTLHHLKKEWKKEITPILELFVDRTPLSFLEEKDYSLVWHYRNVNPELALNRVNELKNILVNFIVNLNIGFLEGNKVIEIKNLGINKGAAAIRMIRKQKSDFILSIGDDLTDEDMFAVLDANAFSIRIGNEKSKAKFHLKSYKDVRLLLTKLGGY